MQKEIEAFLSQQGLGDMSGNTSRQYGCTFKMFLRFLAEDKDIRLVGKQHATAFLEYLSKPSQDRRHKNPYKRSSIIAVRACLSSFFQYMMETDRIASNPMPMAGRMSRPPRNPVYLPETEKERLFGPATNPRRSLF
jgi:site-specific recombinase XerD